MLSKVGLRGEGGEGQNLSGAQNHFLHQHGGFCGRESGGGGGPSAKEREATEVLFCWGRVIEKGKVI